MKKIFLTFVVLLAAFACSKMSINEKADSQLFDKDTDDCSFRVTRDGLRQYLQVYKGYELTKALDKVTIEPFIFESDTVFYLINYDEGWELLSADKRTPKVLMKCLSGSISIQDLYFNEAESDYLTSMARNIKSLRSLDGDSSVSYNDSQNAREELRSVTVEEQDHLLVTKWGQSSPWNIYAPYTDSNMTTHCRTGCVMVAAAQLLYYLHFKIGQPAKTYGYFSASDSYIPDGASYLVLGLSDIFYTQSSMQNIWSQMRLTQSGTGSATYVSALMVRLGYLFQAHYMTTGTSSALYKTTQVFDSNFGISSQKTYTSSQFKTILYNQIMNRQMPVGAGLSGHAVVIDGFRRETAVLDAYPLSSEAGNSDNEQPERTTTVTDYVAVNWGWNGTGDASGGSTIWYNMDSTWYVGGNSYSSINYLVYDFQFQSKK